MSISSGVCAALLTVMLTLIATAGRSADEKEPPVSGLFKGNGKEAKLAFVTALKGEPSLDKPTTVLVFTEKDHSKEKNPKIFASFGRFGSALIITVNQEGDIIGCQVRAFRPREERFHRHRPDEDERLQARRRQGEGEALERR